jgi:hypothetical protein
MGRSEVLDALNAKGYLRKMAGITMDLGDASGNGWINSSALMNYHTANYFQNFIAMKPLHSISFI